MHKLFMIPALVLALGASKAWARGAKDGENEETGFSMTMRIPELTDSGANVSDQLEILSFHHGIARGEDGGEGGGSGDALSMQDLSVVLAFDATTPVLMKMCADGVTLKRVTLELKSNRKAGGYAATYELTDVKVTSVRPGGSSRGADDRPLLELSLMAASWKVGYVGGTTSVERVIAVPAKAAPKP